MRREGGTGRRGTGGREGGGGGGREGGRKGREVEKRGGGGGREEGRRWEKRVAGERERERGLCIMDWVAREMQKREREGQERGWRGGTHWTCGSGISRSR